jgi:hypothetical protein
MAVIVCDVAGDLQESLVDRVLQLVRLDTAPDARPEALRRRSQRDGRALEVLAQPVRLVLVLILFYRKPDISLLASRWS